MFQKNKNFLWLKIYLNTIHFNLLHLERKMGKNTIANEEERKETQSNETTPRPFHQHSVKNENRCTGFLTKTLCLISFGTDSWDPRQNRKRSCLPKAP